MAAGGWVTLSMARGVLKGKKNKTPSGKAYCSFLGIPYGKPPVGDLRFKPPQPAKKWSGIRDATKEGNMAPQIDFLTHQYGGDEDCLYLNVFTPRVPTGSPSNQLPVMVWIHGGGFSVGSNSVEMYGPDYLIEHDVVVVTINYRVGVLGFASTGDSVIAGNMGLKDQVLALKWVKDHIASFDGNPKNVTIFGESAGAMSSHGHILSPRSKGLFDKAILQSGTALPDTSARVPERTFVLAQRLGCNSKDSTEVAEFLKQVPAKTLVEKLLEGRTKEDEEKNVMFPFLPTIEAEEVEDAFYSKYPIEILKSGKYNRVPLIIGINSMEGLMFLMELNQNPNMLRTLNTSFQRLIPYDLPVPKDERLILGREMKGFYFGNEPLEEDTLERYVQLRGDWIFNYPAVRAARAHSAQPTPPVYFYLFNVDAGLNGFKKFIKAEKFPGASHADDVPYIFRSTLGGGVEVLPDSVEANTIARMTKMWTNFAKTGNPTPQQDGILNVVWPPFKPKDNSYLHINNGGLSVGKDVFKERMEFWDRQYNSRVKK